MSLPGQRMQDEEFDAKVQRLIDKGFDPESARIAVEEFAAHSTDPQRVGVDDHRDDDAYDSEGHNEAHSAHNNELGYQNHEDEGEHELREETRPGRSRNVAGAQAEPAATKPPFKLKPLHYAAIAFIAMGIGFVSKTFFGDKSTSAIASPVAPSQNYFQAGAPAPTTVQPPLPSQAVQSYSANTTFPQGQGASPMTAAQPYQASRTAPSGAAMQPAGPGYVASSANVGTAAAPSMSAQAIAYSPASATWGDAPAGATQPQTQESPSNQYVQAQAQGQFAHPAQASSPTVDRVPPAQAETAPDAPAPIMSSARDEHSRLSSADVQRLTEQLDALESQIKALRSALPPANGERPATVAVHRPEHHAAPRRYMRAVQHQATAAAKLTVLAADSNSIVLQTDSGDQTYHVGDTLPTGAKYSGYSDGRVHTSRGDVVVE